MPYASLTKKKSVYNKTLEYVKTFTKFSTTDAASAVREYALISSLLLFPADDEMLMALRRVKDSEKRAGPHAVRDCPNSKSLSCDC